jgi:AbiU2
LWKVPERHVLHPTLIEAGAERQSVERLTNVELTHEIVSHYESRLTSLSSLTELRQSRDKVIAHNEAIERSTLQPPTWGAAISLVEYAKDFVATISFGYLSTSLGRVGGDYNLSDNARRTSKQLRRLLDAADISG